ISKKQNQYSKIFQIEWIQRCRDGYGEPYHVIPPVIYSDSGVASYYAAKGTLTVLNPVSPFYFAHYRSV
ncbi:hypothetical protein RvY_19370, partial [Ramazzottius varieornatus]